MKLLFVIPIFLLSLVSSGQKYQTNEYTSTVNLELINKFLSTKEASYNKNHKKVSDKINTIQKLIEKVYRRNNYKFSEFQLDYLADLYNKTSRITKTMISSNSETYEILKYLDKVEDTIIDWL